MAETQAAHDHEGIRQFHADPVGLLEPVGQQLSCCVGAGPAYASCP